MGGEVEGQARRGFGREALRRLQLRDPLPERADDPPAARVRAGGDRRRGGEDHPRRRPLEVRLEVPRRDERERHDPHRLLRVVRSVGEGEEARRDELEPAEDAVDDAGRPASDHPHEDGHEHERAEESEDRCAERRDQHLVREAVPEDHVEPRLRDARTEHSADEGVARARGQTEVPGQQVPGDRSDQACEHDTERHRVRVDDPLRDRGGDLERRERAREVQDRGQGDRDAWMQRARRDPGRDRVRRVVEAVGEVEEERDRDDRDEQQRSVHGRLRRS